MRLLLLGPKEPQISFKALMEYSESSACFPNGQSTVQFNLDAGNLNKINPNGILAELNHTSELSPQKQPIYKAETKIPAACSARIEVIPQCIPGITSSFDEDKLRLSASALIGKRVLSVGEGDTGQVASLYKNGVDAYAIDYDDGYKTKTNPLFKEAPERYQWGDATDLKKSSLAKIPSDYVISFCLMCQLGGELSVRALTEGVKALKPGGQLRFSTFVHDHYVAEFNDQRKMISKAVNSLRKSGIKVEVYLTSLNYVLPNQEEPRPVQLIIMQRLPQGAEPQGIQKQCPSAGEVIELDDVSPVISELGKTPVYDIKIYQNKKISQQPYMEFQPAPFFYKSDINAAKKKDLPFFKIGGVNCDATIQKVSTITGVSVENLSLRARGRAPYIRSDQDKERKSLPEWKGSPAIWLRASGKGFLGPQHVITESKKENTKHLLEQKEALRKLLLADNSKARKVGLTHQQIIAPILTAIENHSVGSTEFVWEGETYNVTAFGDSQKFLGHSQPWDEATNKNHSGWTAQGIQGSFFDDELATWGKYYRIARKKDKAGVESEITIDGLTPHLIYRYGFYQNGPYRVDPERIINFFGIKTMNPSPWDKCSERPQ